MFIQIILGIIAAFFVAAIFLFIKPRLEIAPKIARRPFGNKTSVTDDVFFIKVVNRSLFRARDFTFSISISTWDGHVRRDIEVEPTRVHIDNIAPYRKNDERAQYAIWIGFRVLHPFNLPPNAYIQFSCSATHPYSNAKSTFSQEYRESDIEIGEYETGLSMAIVQPSPVNL